MDEGGTTTGTKIIDEEPPISDPEPEPAPPTPEPPGEARKYYVDSGSVEIAAHMVYELDPEGRQLRVVKFTDYTGEKVRKMYSSAAELRSKWGDAVERAAIIAGLEERGITFEEMAEAANQPDADPFDLLCHIAYNAPLRTRRERAQALRRDKKDFFEEYGSDAAPCSTTFWKSMWSTEPPSFKFPKS